MLMITAATALIVVKPELIQKKLCNVSESVFLNRIFHHFQSFTSFCISSFLFLFLLLLLPSKFASLMNVCVNVNVWLTEYVFKKVSWKIIVN